MNYSGTSVIVAFSLMKTGEVLSLSPKKEEEEVVVNSCTLSHPSFISELYDQLLQRTTARGEARAK